MYRTKHRTGNPGESDPEGSITTKVAMAYRGSGSRVNEFDDRDAYYSAAPTPPRAPVREYESDRESRVPAFLREDARRNESTGPLVLRQRDVETMERSRRRSPTPPPPRRAEMTERDEVRIREVERERVRSPSRGPPVERRRTRFVERERSPSPPHMPPERMPVRFVERERSLSPVDRGREEHIRIVRQERGRSPSCSPSPHPPPPPPVIRGPTIERDVVTHYRDIDHGENIF